MSCLCGCHGKDSFVHCENCCEGAEMTEEQVIALRQYLRSHREDIEASLNDFGDLAPMLDWLDA